MDNQKLLRECEELLNDVLDLRFAAALNARHHDLRYVVQRQLLAVHDRAAKLLVQLKCGQIE